MNVLVDTGVWSLAYFLVGVDGCTSRLREVKWYTEALGALGFVDIRVIPGPFDVVVATRA